MCNSWILQQVDYWKHIISVKFIPNFPLNHSTVKFSGISRFYKILFFIRQYFKSWSFIKEKSYQRRYLFWKLKYFKISPFFWQMYEVNTTAHFQTERKRKQLNNVIYSCLFLYFCRSLIIWKKMQPLWIAVCSSWILPQVDYWKLLLSDKSIPN